jgi:hypothetical protein
MKKIIVILLLSMIFAVGNVYAEKYALLVSAGEATTDDEFGNSEYWYDLFLAYEDLRIDKGFSKDNIFMHYGDGYEFDTEHERYTRGYHGWDPFYELWPNDTSDITANLYYISTLTEPEDTVVIRWVVGHGRAAGYDIYEVLIENDVYEGPFGTPYIWVKDHDLISIINNNLPENYYNQRYVVWMTCHSGCYVTGNQRLDNEKSAIITSCLGWELSYGIWTDTWHAEFNYWFTGFSYGEAPDDGGPIYLDVDLDEDGDMSLLELYSCTIDSVYWGGSNPQIGGADLDYSYISDDFRAWADYDYFAPNYIKIGGDNYNDEPTNFTIRGVTKDVRMACKTGYIQFNPGFHAEEGCEFVAKIDPDLYDDFNTGLSSENINSAPELDLIEKDVSSEKKEESKESIPKVFSCAQNSPNPFASTTNINYGLPKDSDVNLVVFNIAGQAVKTLVNANQSAGFRSVSWDGTNSAGAQMPQGIYFYVFKAGDFEKHHKMILIK